MSETRSVFNNANDGNGVLQECERICRLGAAGITGNAQLLKDFTARVNNAIDRFFAIGRLYDKNWVLDDRGFGDNDLTKGLPILSTTLTNGVADYLLDTDMVMVGQPYAKDLSGTLRALKPQEDTENPYIYTGTGTGAPTHYKMVGNSIIVYPTPNYTIAGGLKIPVKRVGRHFASTDGAVPLGIPSLFFEYVARKASYPYLIEKELKHADRVRKEIGSADPRDRLYGGDELAIAQHFANRNSPGTPRLIPRSQNNR